jgi:pimeloyl-ACP methyl ester carboxylesterase
MITQLQAREARERLLAALPVTERQRQLGSISTAVLEGGDGPALILLHGPGGNAAHWMRVIPDLVTTHRVIVPDLPGQGASTPGEGLDAVRVLAWLNELIERTCGGSLPALVGYALGGAIAARFAARAAARLDRLVLVDTLGLVDFNPAPPFGNALHDFLGRPDEFTHEGLWRHCAFDLDRLRQQMGADWEAFEAYNVDRARAPAAKAALMALMNEFGVAAIPPEQLERIRAPTSLIWGRHDLATPLAVAEAASKRYGWPLQVIEGANDDPPVEQPGALVRALRTALRTPPHAE